MLDQKAFIRPTRTIAPSSLRRLPDVVIRRW
jgi:hypothetical protein